MKIIKLLMVIFALNFSVTDNATAGQHADYATESTGLDVMLEIPARAFTFVQTVAGAGLFVATAPITGVLTAIRPHNAIQKSFDFLVVSPAKNTFVRPIGQWY